MEDHIGFMELNDDYIWLQQYFHDRNDENQVFSPLDNGRKVNAPLYDDYISQLENDEKGYDVLYTFEGEVNCKNVAFCQNHILADF